MSKDQQPQYVIMHFSDGSTARFDWEEWHKWQRKQLDDAINEQVQRIVAALDAQAAAQLEIMKRDLGDERPTEH